MDFATILGLAVGLAMVLAAMLSGGDAGPFLHIPSLMITAGGTLSAVMIHFPAKQILNAFSVARNCFTLSLPEPVDVLAKFRSYAATARRSGLLALESELTAEKDSFLQLGLEMASSGCDAVTLKTTLDRELTAIEQRHVSGRRLFEVLGNAAPAWGMVGTLIGLVQMLRSLDDPRLIGSGLALALLTTLYGAVFANLVCIPLAGKLESRHSQEVMIRQVMTEGFLAILEEHAPGRVEERLRAWVPPQQRSEIPPEKNRAA